MKLTPFSTNPLKKQHGCFVWGTKITLGDKSEKNIEDIDRDEEVLTFNEFTGEQEIKKVAGIRRYASNHIVTYELIDGSIVQCTEDHPIYVNGLEIASYNPTLTEERYDVGTEESERSVSKIKEGDKVNMVSGKESEIVAIIVNDYGDTSSCIIEVVDNHNFYANGILVHNK
jgi:intein/homing endonuclease